MSGLMTLAVLLGLFVEEQGPGRSRAALRAARRSGCG